MQNIDQEFLQEEPSETPVEVSPLLKQYRQNELFTNFDYVSEMNVSSNASELHPHGSYIENVNPRLGNRHMTEVNRTVMHNLAG